MIGVGDDVVQRIKVGLVKWKGALAYCAYIGNVFKMCMLRSMCDKTRGGLDMHRNKINNSPCLGKTKIDVVKY